MTAPEEAVAVADGDDSDEEDLGGRRRAWVLLGGLSSAWCKLRSRGSHRI